MNWKLTQYDQGVGWAVTQAGFKLKFPDENGHVNSVQADRIGMPPQPPRVLQIIYRIRAVSGTPVFKYVDHGGTGDLAPNVRPSIRSSFLEDRYWPSGDNCIFLRLCQQSIYTIHLQPAFWQDVNGKIASGGFYPTLALKGLWVLSFGGGGNFEHGVYVTGGVAAFDLLGFHIQ